MSGSNQSSNLTGMMTQMGTALSTQGSSYADDLKRNIQNITRPEVKPDDDASMMNMANWASKMGRTDEAKIYQKQAEHISTAKTQEAIRTQEAGFAQGMMKPMEKFNAASAVGDWDAANASIQEMTVAAKGATTSTQMNAAMGAIKKSRDALPEVKKTQLNNRVAKLMDADTTMANMPEEVRGTDQGKNALARHASWKRQQLDDDPELNELYNKTIQDGLQTQALRNAAAGDARETQAGSVRSAFSNVLNNNPSNPQALEMGVQAARKEADKLGTPEAVAALKDVEHIYEGYKEVSEKALAIETLPEAVVALGKQVDAMVARLPEGHGETYRKQFKDIEKLSKKGEQFYKGQALKDINVLMGRLAEETLNMNSDLRKLEQRGAEEFRKKRQDIITGNATNQNMMKGRDMVNEKAPKWSNSFENLPDTAKINLGKDVRLIDAGMEPEYYQWGEDGLPVIKGGGVLSAGSLVPRDGASMDLFERSTSDTGPQTDTRRRGATANRANRPTGNTGTTESNIPPLPGGYTPDN